MDIKTDEELKFLKKIDVFDVVLYPDNTKTHDNEQLKKLIRVIKKYNFDDPIILGTIKGKNPVVVHGNGRVLALREYSKQNNVKIEVPYFTKDFKSKNELAKYTFEKNAVSLETSIDKNKTKNMLFELKQDDIEIYNDLVLTDYNVLNDIKIEDIELKVTDHYEDNLSDMHNTKERLFIFDEQATADAEQNIKNPYKFFESKNPYDIPTLPDNIIFNGNIEDIISKCDRISDTEDGIKEGSDIYEIYNYYSNAFKIKTKNKNKILSFFVYDDKFESIFNEVKARVAFEKKIWNDSEENIINTCIENNFNIVVEPNFSLLLTEPCIYRLMSVYKMHWVANYLGCFGIKIIPTISILDKNTLDMIIDTYPNKSKYAFICGKEASLKQDSFNIDLIQQSIDAYVNKMKLETIFVYGLSDINIEMFNKIKTTAKIKIIQSDKNKVNEIIKNKLNSKHNNNYSKK